MYAVTTYKPGIGPVQSKVARTLPEARRIVRDMEKTYGLSYCYRILFANGEEFGEVIYEK